MRRNCRPDSLQRKKGKDEREKKGRGSFLAMIGQLRGLGLSLIGGEACVVGPMGFRPDTTDLS